MMYDYSQPYWVQSQPRMNPYGQIQQQQSVPIQNSIFGQQQPVMQTGLNGRTVNDISEVNANEVPMDGSKAVFPKADGTEIYVKQWNANGTISTVTYKLSTTDESVKSVNQMEQFNIIMNQRFDAIEQMIDEIKVGSPARKSVKKEVSE